MNLLFRLVFVCFITLVIIGMQFATDSFQLILPTGEVILITNRTIQVVLIGFGLFLLLFYFVKKKEEKRTLIPIEELERMIYVIDEVDKSKLSERGKAKKLVRGVLPYIGKILKEYEEFVYSLPPDQKNVLRTIYFSLTGKHGHYAEERLLKDSRHLREVILEILRKYKV